jgi:hypothetical protein
MKSIKKLFFTLILLCPGIALAQTEKQIPERVITSEELYEDDKDPKYKNYKPSLKKLSLTKGDLGILCKALNLSKEDSIKCNVNKIWTAVTDPYSYDSIFRAARYPEFWSRFNKTFSSGWALHNEAEYERKVVLEGFFNPLIYAIYIAQIDDIYTPMMQVLPKLSAIRKLKEEFKTINLPNIKTKKVREVLHILNDSLHQHGYSLMIIHPQKGVNHKQFPFDEYNIISTARGYEKQLIRIFKNLGLKIEEFRSFKKK